MEKIGVIGLGNIAQKAYLPVMAQLQDHFEWHLTTRNQAKGQQLMAQYGFQHLHQTLAELIAVKPLAVFVHTPTTTHADIIQQLLMAGINVYVDKPVAEDLATVKRLYQLAADQNLLLTCGFNRRFAPAYQALKAIPDKQQINASKIREQASQSAQFAVFDLMIHSVDTALFLMDEHIATETGRLITQHDGMLNQAYLNLTSNHEQVSVTTNLVGGVNLEQVSVQSATGLTTVSDLTKTTQYQTAQQNSQQRPDWEPMLVSRGFEPLIKAFLKAVQNTGVNPVAPATAILSHAVCSRLINGQKVL